MKLSNSHPDRFNRDVCLDAPPSSISPEFPLAPDEAATSLITEERSTTDRAAPLSIIDMANRMFAGMAIDPGANLGGIRRLPEIENAMFCLEQEPVDAEEVIEGILHRGAKGVIGGASKSYKTWILADMAVSVATGQPWLGFPTRQGKVLYLNLELQKHQFEKRLRTICRSKGISNADLEPLSLWHLRGYVTDFTLMGVEIVQRIKNEGYALVIVDPIYKALGGRDENKAGDITNLLNELEKLAVQSGAAVIFGAHFSKGNQAGKDSIDRIGGSGVFARDPDSIFIVTRHEQEEAYSVEAILRNHAPITPFVIRWEFPLMRRDARLDPSLLRNPAKSKRKYFPEQILDLLGEQEWTYGEWKTAARKEVGMSASEFDRLRGELVDAGEVIKTTGKRYCRKPEICSTITPQT